MKTVWKFPLASTVVTKLQLPVGAQVLTVQMQYDEPQLWVLVDPQAPKEERRFQLVGTGHEFEPQGALKYINTIQVQGGLFVFHLFEVA
jgi:hypothetical protein